MTLATRLTVLRLVLVPVGLLWLFFVPAPWQFTGALAIFVIAAATDWFDGYFARKYKQTSPLGTFLDPLADKLLVLTFFVFLTVVGGYPLWLLLCMLIRELVHDGFRNFIASRGQVIGANWWSKWKAGFQMLSICMMLLGGALAWDIGTGDERVVFVTTLASNLLMIAALVSGVIGTAVFFRRHASALV